MNLVLGENIALVGGLPTMLTPLLESERVRAGVENTRMRVFNTFLTSHHLTRHGVQYCGGQLKSTPQKPYMYLKVN
jgi:hypothetical protein